MSIPCRHQSGLAWSGNLGIFGSGEALGLSDAGLIGVN